MDAKNLLIIMSDQHHPKLMGCADHSMIQTPNFDKLAAQGTRFSAAYTNCPICVPARASFMTGQYVHQIGCWDNATAYVGTPNSWGHRMRQAQIPVESIGKLHFRNENDDTGFDQQAIPMHIKDGIGQVWGSVRDPLPLREGGEAMVGYAGAGTSDYNKYDLAVTKSTCDWLQNKSKSTDDGPWVLYAGLVAPHFPYIVPEEFFKMYPIEEMPEVHAHPERGYVRHPWVEQFTQVVPGIDRNSDEERRIATAAYYGLCSFLDHNVGRILDELSKAGLADNTRVIYTSDHGDMIGSRGQWGKSLLYDDSAGIPLIMAGADIPRNTVCDTPVSLVDLYPTIMESVGHSLKPEESQSLPGRSLHQIANAEYDSQRTVFSEYHAYGAPSGAFMLRQGHFKYNYYVGFDAELFDLQNDPQELTNLISEETQADRVRDFETQLREIMDPEAIDKQAKADQASFIEQFGGVELALRSGTKGETPPPKV
jgi:choline-sulfatase